MVKTARNSYLLGAATLWPPLYFLGFLGVALVVVLSQPNGDQGNGPPAGWVALVAAHIFTILLSIGLIAIYLVDVFRNGELREKQDVRTMWIVLIIVVGAFAMPVYWWLYLRPGSDAFRRRQATG